MKLVMRLVINAFALLIVAYLVPGFVLDSIWTAIVAAIVIGIVNTLIKPLLHIIALPITILTLGVGGFLINVLLLWGVSTIVPGFHIAGFWTAVVSSIVLSLVTWFLHKLSSD